MRIPPAIRLQTTRGSIIICKILISSSPGKVTYIFALADILTCRRAKPRPIPQEHKDQKVRVDTHMVQLTKTWQEYNLWAKQVRLKAIWTFLLPAATAIIVRDTKAFFFKKGQNLLIFWVKVTSVEASGHPWIIWLSSRWLIISPDLVVLEFWSFLIIINSCHCGCRRKEKYFGVTLTTDFADWYCSPNLKQPTASLPFCPR